MESAGGERPPTTRILSIPKEGERILAPTRRPDGTLRKPIRIRAGYVPQDEVAIYQSKGALLRKGLQPDAPPGYDPALDAKPKTKSAKRNERKKERRHQSALASSTEKGKNLDSEQAEMIKSEEIPSAELMTQRLESVESVTDQMGRISVSATSVVISPSTDLKEDPKPENSGPDIDKRIRALKKKIRLAEGRLQGNQQNMKPEQLEKMAKMEEWREELKLLEDRKANLVSH
ncbi:partner of Y14 and mago-like [Phoenix dactylifera]|uniref:Partner of Y14 and mago-like n=1 Tax=Phoenix dactylifera TaxID=42345 RepID=A0A8B9APT0_PHODC|nr:partner of Y14 and mago-like [Phoenix dactylifera]